MQEIINRDSRKALNKPSNELATGGDQILDCDNKPTRGPIIRVSQKPFSDLRLSFQKLNDQLIHTWARDTVWREDRENTIHNTKDCSDTYSAGAVERLSRVGRGVPSLR
ncbi:hypothetical protein J6590_071276 [Homalodisca vitripennis]|nr:hypothetical protein J6590_071276 [Homalodisca vitripennis]